MSLQVSLLMEKGDTKDDLRLPNDEQLLSQVSHIWCLSADLGMIQRFDFS